MNFVKLILIVIKLILTLGLNPSDAVARVAGDYGVDYDKLWDLLPDIYKQ